MVQQFLMPVYKRKYKNYKLDQSLFSNYNVKYSFLQYLKPDLNEMSNIQVSLPTSPIREKNTQYTLISLDNQLNLAQDPQKMHELAISILNFARQAEDSYFEASLQLITKMFNKGYANHLTQSPQIIEKIMKHFVLLFKRYQKEATQDLKYRKLFVLSVIAELIRQQSKYLVSFSRNFLFKVFEIECQKMMFSNERNQVLAIIGVIFSNLSKQSNLIKQLKIEKLFKESILNNYSLIEESSTLRQFNQCILQLQTKRTVLFTLCELQRYKIKEMLLKGISSSQGEHLVQYLQRLFPRLKISKKIQKQ